MKIDNAIEHSKVKEFQLIKKGDVVLSTFIALVVFGLFYQGVHMLYITKHDSSDGNQYAYFR